MDESKPIEQAVRQGFKIFNHFMIAMWRLGLGGWVNFWPSDGGWEGVVEEIKGREGRVDLIRQVLIASGFIAYAAGINPRKMDDAALDEVTAKYRLMCIRLRGAPTGGGGAGELGWSWPLRAL